METLSRGVGSRNVQNLNQYGSHQNTVQSSSQMIGCSQRSIKTEWKWHSNQHLKALKVRSRGHAVGTAALGPGLPKPMSDQVPPNEHRHRLPVGYRVVKRSVLGGLHHEYRLAKEGA
jgi:hypothetical protein